MCTAVLCLEHMDGHCDSGSFKSVLDSVTELNVVVVVCLQSSYTPCHSSFCLSRDDAPASTRHHGEGCVCLGDGLPLLRPHLPPLL